MGDSYAKGFRPQRQVIDRSRRREVAAEADRHLAAAREQRARRLALRAANGEDYELDAPSLVGTLAAALAILAVSFLAFASGAAPGSEAVVAVLRTIGEASGFASILCAAVWVCIRCREEIRRVNQED
jgi:hypothetical protein